LPRQPRAVRSIDEISHKYLGIPYPNFTGLPEVRVLVTIEADSILPPRG
jgi:hypothetical protein